MADVPDLDGMSVRELEEKLGEIDAEIKSIQRDTHAAGIGQLAELLAQSPTEGNYEAAEQVRELLEQKKAVQETLDRKQAVVEGLGDPWKRPVPPAPDPEAPEFGWSTKKKATAVAIGAAVVAAIVAAIAVLMGGGSDKKSSTTATQLPATTTPATNPTSTPTDTTAVAAAPTPVHFLVIRAHQLVTDVKLCGAGPQTSGTGNWYFRLKGDPADYDGKIAVLQGKGPNVAGTYRLAIHGGEVGMTKHLPCATPGTTFSIGLVSVDGRMAIQDGAIG